MSTIHLSADAPARPVITLEDVASVLKPPAQNIDRIGVEAEAFLVDAHSGAPARADAFVDILSAYKELAGFADFTTERTAGGEIITGLANATGLHAGANITVEPGFQPEYAGAPQNNIHEVAASLDAHLGSLAVAAQTHGYLVTMPGLHPLFAGHSLPLIGKKRYELMTAQAWKKAGEDGLTAMRGTTGVQYNLDTAQENWVQRYRVAFALQPFVSALSANSPYKNGADTKDASHRSVLWFRNWGGNWAQDIAETVFADDFSLPKLTNYIATHLPLPFLVRPGANGEVDYINVGGRTLKQLLAVRPSELGPINETDVEAMVGFAFLPVKPKTKGVIEMRGADGSYPLRLAQGAFEVGILYDRKALEMAESLLGALDGKSYVKLSEGIARSGLNAIVPGGGTVRSIATELLTIAHGGLVRRGLNEVMHLGPLMDITYGKKNTPGDALYGRVRQIARTRRLPAQTALTLAFLETAVPVKANADLPIRHHQAPLVTATPYAL